MITININAVGFKADAKLEDFIEKKVSKLTNLYDRVLGVEVILKLDAKEKVENKISEIRFLVPGEDIFAKKQCNSFEESIDENLEAIRKQLIKHKQKVIGK
ncbi:HPF/RaiA family ribosome-associated protein [Bacteroidales bacterium OttesenSCG-928-K03]|nr:HPF/RaiA family ribosome-associated protein [Odoribacter sp. OttesenSCG-928-L07]MDL2239222.1 HPF/RaiA family ribosome-associated protein [Bacteroidales bacterium OttesenSCG-928-L14]MDL2240064.1 HPF/RaiA family ribosome-associated protein [Bacteroidales bacterium OttesenSCG-928-K22]MDL2242333.1 HPF/RaiA family ribosome-associated protein [Bacteroidales bacterium OttesenSCG-928-K03]